ncbi:hypothetical protein [Asticcacaulis tiandongensis]|uniref:hypothetical protein n=1 Tax=Asticcacaulis tiandongensis TaxID=2565365 RepID=UPI00112D16AE|nr:hypothetical protein [Asticcacaulis tiandongensis]
MKALFLTAISASCLVALPAMAATESTPVKCRNVFEPYTGPADELGSGGYIVVTQFQIPDMPYPKDFVARGDLLFRGDDFKKLINKLPESQWVRGGWGQVGRNRVGVNWAYGCRATLSWTKPTMTLGTPVLSNRPSDLTQKRQLIVPSAQAPLVKLADGSYISNVDGKRENIVFKLGSTHRINGKGLSGGTAGWILGTTYGGSMLEIVSESDTQLVVKVTAVSGARTRWPANQIQYKNQSSVRMRIEAKHGDRVFEFSLPNSVYDCKRTEANCIGN